MEVLCLKQGPRDKFTTQRFFYELACFPYCKKVTEQIFACSSRMLAAYLFYVEIGFLV